jgi:hypothetical protein
MIPQRRCFTRPRAFATTTAIMLIALVGVALAAATAALATAARQTRTAQDDAQLRQLLLTGNDFLRTAPGQGEHKIALPPALRDNGATLTVRLKDREATINAFLGSRQATQIIALDPAGKIKEVRLAN